MKPSRRQAGMLQLDLFRSAPQRMKWAALPADVQEEVQQLVVQMLRQHLSRSARSEAEREVRHER